MNQLAFLTTHKAVWCITLVVSVRLSVCLSDDNFQKPARRKFIFAHAAYLDVIRVEFVYELKVKLTGAKNFANSCFHNVKL